MPEAKTKSAFFFDEQLEQRFSGYLCPQIGIE